jgi:hypothetical protein
MKYVPAEIGVSWPALRYGREKRNASKVNSK